MASYLFETSTISRFDAVCSRSNEDEERLQRFLRLISRSQLNINRSMSLLEEARGRSNPS